MVEKCIESYEHIDFLINGAGVTSRMLVEEMSRRSGTGC